MTTAIATPLPATRAEWLAQRRTGIGGSDVASILGLSPWRTPYQPASRQKITQSPETK